MVDKEKRGSEKLMAAWKARALTEESVREIAEALDKSPAKLEGAEVVGGGTATGVRVSLRYDGDDGPWCGNDILFWLKWHLQNGGNPRRRGSSSTARRGPTSSRWSSTSVTASAEHPGGPGLRRPRRGDPR